VNAGQLFVEPAMDAGVPRKVSVTAHIAHSSRIQAVKFGLGIDANSRVLLRQRSFQLRIHAYEFRYRQFRYLRPGIFASSHFDGRANWSN
jgi:hypothetical protein